MAQEPPLDDDREQDDSDGRRGAPLKRWIGWIGLFNAVIYTLMAGLCALVLMPEGTADLKDDGSPVSNVAKRLRDAVEENAERLELTENELNRYIEDTLVAETDDSLAGRLSEFEGVMIRLGDGTADIVMKRRIAGLPSTVAVRLELEIEAKRVRVAIPGGRFGSLPVYSGLTRLVMPAFVSFKETYDEEVSRMLQAKSITFEEGKVVFLFR